VQDNNANLTPVLRDLYRARTKRARGDQRAHDVTRPTAHGEHRPDVLIMGLAETYLFRVVLQRLRRLAMASTGTPESTAPMTK